MSKRFLISEEDRKNILSLYAKKGIILEQEYTKGVIPKNTGEGIYNLGGYELEVDSNQNIKVFDRYGDNDEFMGEFSGRFSDLKYDLETNSFADSNKVLSANNPLLQKMLPNIREKQTPSNNLGYFVALNEKNKFPTLYALTPIVVKQEQEIPVVDSTVIGLGQSYIPTRQTYRYVKDEILRAAKGGKKEYSDLNFRQFRREFAISLNTIAGPEGDGIIITQKDRFIPRQIGGSKGDPFVFNQTTLSGNGEELLNEFISQFTELKQKDSDLYNTYVDFLKQKSSSIEVLAYSSIDDDPEQTIDYVVGRNAVEGCGGKMKRKDYNQCLSQKRAEKIAGILNQQLPDFPDFIGKGMGETDKFAPGKKWPNASREETLRNRRFDVVLPNYGDTVPED